MEPLVSLTMLGAVESTPNISYMYILVMRSSWNFMRIEFRLVFSRFLSSSWSEKGHEPSRAELKILQLKLWLEPAWLGLITSI